jgi:hypothetical protein
MQLEAIENGRQDDIVPAPSRFLFVNGDLTSKSLSKIETPKLRPVINRHVQRWSFETKGRKKQASVQHPVKRCLGQKIEVPAPCAKASVDGGPEKAKLGVIRRKALKSNVNEHESAVEEPKLKACIWSDGNYLDPFAATGIHVDSGVCQMLQYFTFSWNPFTCSCDVRTHLCMFPCEIEASISEQQPSASVNKIVQGCLKNKTHMYALLASCARRMKNISQQELNSIAKPESYIAKAIHALREHLIRTSEVDQEVVRDIFFMSTCEYFAQNLDCAASYLRILRSMVERIGGFSSIDIYDRRLYWSGDIGLALETGYPPILPAFENSRVYHTYRSGDSSIVKMGRAFQRHDGCIESPLDEIISDMISCAQSIQCIMAARLKIDKQRMFEHGADFLHRLLSLKEPQDNCSLKSQREECCRHALLLWIFNVMIWPSDAAASPSLANPRLANPRLARPLVAVRLKHAICRMEYFGSSCWDSYHELLFWMVAQGSYVVGPGDDQSWFIDRFVRLAGRLRIGSVEQMSDLFREHLYLETFEKADLIRLAGSFFQQGDTQTEAPRWEMRMSSVMTPSDDSTPSANTRLFSLMTLSNGSTPSSQSTP